MSQDSGDDFKPTDDDATSRRRHRRWFVDFKTTLIVDGERINCSIFDLSPGGACAEPSVPQDLSSGDQIIFELPGYGPIPAEIRYITDDYWGLMFLHDEGGEIAVAHYLVMVEQNRPPEAHAAKSDTCLVVSGVEAPCIVEDISRASARVLVGDTRHIMLGQNVALDIVGRGRIEAQVQRIDDDEIVLTFLNEVEEELGVAIGQAEKPD